MTIRNFYFLFQIIFPILLFLFWGEEMQLVISHWLIGMNDPHGFVKGILESSQGLLLRQREVFVSVLSFSFMTSIASFFPSAKRVLALVAIGIFVSLVFPFRNNMILAFFWLGLSCLSLSKPNKGLGWIPFVPYIGLCVVNWSLYETTKLFRIAMVFLFSMLWSSFGFWLDCISSYEQIRTELEAWPVELLDSRIRVLAQQPGVRADWHGVEIHDGQAIVMAEETMRLMAFSLYEEREPFVYQLGKRWGPERAAPLDFERDPETGLFWFVTNEREISGFRLTETGWQKKQNLRLPFPVSYTYMRLREGIFSLVPIQVKHNDFPLFQIVSGSKPSWTRLHLLRNHSQSLQVPFPREIELIPEMNQLILAPDFGKELYSFDLKTGKAETIIETPTMDGKMRWSSSLQRLFVALPNRMEIWVIDLKNKKVDWKIPTQPGVRALAIDEKRNCIVTASVLTGQILIQDIHSGQIMDRFGTVMPMVRELALDSAAGQAVLTTWAAVYQFPYAQKWGE